MGIDLVLSSGFLAFASHAGVLQATEDLGVEIEGLCGTSSGALVGALWASGLSAEEVFALVTERPPLSWVAGHVAPWRGLFRLDPMIAELAARLPASFEDLSRPLAVGVARAADRSHQLLTTGSLPHAVAASCAVPWLFVPISIGDQVWVDGGAVDRTGLVAWRDLRPDRQPVVHLVERSAGAAGEVPAGLVVVRSPRSRAKLWSLGDARARFEHSRRTAHAVLSAALNPEA